MPLNQLHTAVQLHRDGQLQAAHDLYVKLLLQSPQDAKVVSLLGQLQMQMGRVETGLETLNRAAAIAPRDQRIALTLARGLAAADQLESAINLVKELLAVDAVNVESWSALAALYRRRGDYAAELDALEHALALNPDHVPLLISKANALANSLHVPAAIEILQRAATLVPNNANVHNNLGALYLRAGQVQAAVSSLRQALAIVPDYALAVCNLSIALHRSGRLDEAMPIAELAVRLAPTDVEARAELGSILMASGELEAAEDAFQTARAVAPHNQRVLAGLAELRERQGRNAEGLAILNEMLLTGNASADSRLAAASLARRLGQPEQALDLLSALLDDAGDPLDTIDVATRRRLYFLLGDLHDASGRYGRALKCYDRANHRAGADFDADALYKRTDELISAFASVHQSVARPRHPGRIFIVGMPRSGTSLLETMLSQHPAVHAFGESPLLGRLLNEQGGYPRAISELNQAGYDRLADRYCAGLAVSDDSLWVTDKMPLNFWFLGPLARMLPHAVVLHCRRDPRDNLLSCYFQNFLDPALAFTFSLEDLAHYWRNYRRLMTHWRSQFGAMIMDIDYERLVSDPESTLRDITKKLALPWDPAVLTPQLSSRHVTTASHAQVRAAIHQRSVKRFEHYRPFLGERAEIFDILT